MVIRPEREIHPGFGSVIIGDGSGILNNGSRNIFIGRYTAESNTSGYNNVYIGNDAGSEMTTGIYNTFLGAEAGDFAAAGDYDVYVGTRAGYDNDGSNNVVMGYVAGANGENYGNDNTTYSNSVMLGSRAGYLITTGANNVFVGYGSGGNMTSGYRNTLVGAASGSSTLGSNNVLIGYGAGSGVSGDNKLVIHNWNTGTPLVYGEFHSVPSAALFRINGAFEVTEMGVGSGTPVVIDASGEVLKTSSSLKFKNNITTLKSVTNLFMRLRPVSFKWNDLSATPGKEDYGLIAEEVMEILPDLAITNDDGSAEGVSYHNVNIMAIKVIQSQQNEIEELKRRLVETEEKINSILKKME